MATIILSITTCIAITFIRRLVMNEKQRHPVSNPIGSIPIEIASMIFENLGLGDRKRLRLASKPWATAGERYLYPTHTFWMKAIRCNMINLQDVAQIPGMMSSIHTLDIDLLAVSHGKFVKYYADRVRRLGILKVLRMYLDALASHEGYCTGTILAESIPSLKNLKAISICGYGGSYCWDSDRGDGCHPWVAQAAKWWYKNIKKLDFGDSSIVDLRLQNVMNTISNLPSSVSLESLVIYSFPILAFCEWDEKEQTMIDLHHTMHGSFSNLQHLMLTIKPGLHTGRLRIRLRERRPFQRGVERGAMDNTPSDLSPLVGRSLAALILSMQKLRHLHLNWCYEMHYISGHTELRNEWGKCFFAGTFPMLTSLCLYSFQTTEDKLFKFLDRHRDTLIYLSLDSEIMMPGTLGRYRRLCTHLRDNFRLQKFEFVLQSDYLNGCPRNGSIYDREWRGKRHTRQKSPHYRWAQLLEEYVIKGLKWPMSNDDPADNGQMLFWEPLPEFGVEEPDKSERYFFY
ncbi:hypothetical protein CJF31_00011916 [Rutstroemia sp. NJR-2017a BVV2]|nr:hypothetical protein CJF31_00011916 [Rutstroemia sp. NJR-2017a BVV2]